MLLKVKLSLKHGICDESCTGFASFGLMLCAIGDGSEAYRFAKLGLQLLDRTTARNQFMPSVYFLAYGWVAPFKIPLRSTFDKLQCAIATARDTCDFEFASSNAYLYLINLFVSGEKLAIIDERSVHFATMMKQFKHGPCTGGEVDNHIAIVPDVGFSAVIDFVEMVQGLPGGSHDADRF